MAHTYKAKYDYVELMVEQREDRWLLTLKDNRHGSSVVHDEEFATAAEAQEAALALAEHHIHVQHNDTLLAKAALTWQTS